MLYITHNALYNIRLSSPIRATIHSFFCLAPCLFTWGWRCSCLSTSLLRITCWRVSSLQIIIVLVGSYCSSSFICSAKYVGMSFTRLDLCCVCVDLRFLCPWPKFTEGSCCWRLSLWIISYLGKENRQRHRSCWGCHFHCLTCCPTFSTWQAKVSWASSKAIHTCVLCTFSQLPFAPSCSCCFSSPLQSSPFLTASTHTAASAICSFPLCFWAPLLIIGNSYRLTTRITSGSCEVGYWESDFGWLVRWCFRSFWSWGLIISWFSSYNRAAPRPWCSQCLPCCLSLVLSCWLLLWQGWAHFRVWSSSCLHFAVFRWSKKPWLRGCSFYPFPVQAISLALYWRAQAVSALAWDC